MTTGGQVFLDQLTSPLASGFERRFARIAIRLDLGAKLTGAELELLYEAAHLAGLCNIAVNGLGGYGGQIEPEKERHRRRQETDFLIARDVFYASPGWQNLPATTRGRINRIFLNVFVTEDNLAW